MKYHALIALVATACAGTSIGDKGSGDTSSGGDCTITSDGPPSIDTVSADCDGSGENITYEVKTTGLTGDGYVWAVEKYAQPWDEIHDLPSVEFDSCGTWDDLKVTVAATGDFQQYDNGNSSAWTCDKVRSDGLTYAFAVNDLNGNIADCKVAGHNPTNVVDEDYGPDYYGTGPDPINLSSCSKTTLAR